MSAEDFMTMIAPDDTWRCTQCRRDCGVLEAEDGRVLSVCCVAAAYNTAPEPACDHMLTEEMVCGWHKCRNCGHWPVARGNTSPEPPVPHRWPATIDASDLLVQQLEAAINGQPIEDYNVLIDLKDQIQRVRK